MSLLRDVVAVLQAEGIAHALIGAAAMAVHGVSRATAAALEAPPRRGMTGEAQVASW